MEKILTKAPMAVKVPRRLTFPLSPLELVTRIISHKERAIRNDFRGLVILKENLKNDSPNIQKIKEHFT